MFGFFELNDPLLDLGAEFVGFGAQLLIGELLDLRLERVDLRYPGHQPLDLAFVASTKNFGNCLVNQNSFPLSREQPRNRSKQPGAGPSEGAYLAS